MGIAVLLSFTPQHCHIQGNIMFGRPEISTGRLFVEIASLVTVFVALAAILLK
jgi:hypothetical protein